MQNRGYIVKDGNHYLYPSDGDVGHTTSLELAYVFKSEAEARMYAEDHADSGFQIIPAPQA